MVAGFSCDGDQAELKRMLAMAGLVGESPALLRALEKFGLIAQSKEAVQVIGETGTGKELVARGIHMHSARATQAFIAINCATLPESLLEDKLFGHEPGAFTDARSRRPGCFLLADKGTLFLDEVQSLTPRAQAALLRVVEDGKICPVGSDKELNVDVRIITATNASLQKMVAAGTFRQDLFYRLSVLRICLPPLRERAEDILLLAKHFLEENLPDEQRVPELTAEVKQILLSYRWPGNVRELRNAISRSAPNCLNREVRAEDLEIEAPNEPQGDQERPVTREQLRLAKQRACDAVERDFLLRLLARHRGNITQAAKELRMERSWLGKVMKKHAIHVTPLLKTDWSAGE